MAQWVVFEMYMEVFFMDSFFDTEAPDKLKVMQILMLSVNADQCL